MHISSALLRCDIGATLAIDDQLLDALRSQAESRAVPWDQWAKWILTEATQPPNRPTNDELNCRRLDLIDQKYDRGLTEPETRELAALQALSETELEVIDRGKLDWLDQFEERVAQVLKPTANG